MQNHADDPDYALAYFHPGSPNRARVEAELRDVLFAEGEAAPGGSGRSPSSNRELAFEGLGQTTRTETTSPSPGGKGVDRAESEYVPPAILVPIYAELGDLDRAFEWLEKAYEMRSRSMVWINVSHDFDALRGDPRFHAIVRRMGLAVSDDRLE